MTPPDSASAGRGELRKILDKVYEAGVNAANHNKIMEDMLQDENGVYGGYRPTEEAAAALEAYILAEMQELLPEMKTMSKTNPGTATLKAEGFNKAVEQMRGAIYAKFHAK